MELILYTMTQTEKLYRVFLGDVMKCVGGAKLMLCCRRGGWMKGSPSAVSAIFLDLFFYQINWCF